MRTQKTSSGVVAIAGISLLGLAARAEFGGLDVENVPTDRLLANLEAKAKENPKKVEVLVCIVFSREPHENHARAV